MSQFNFKFYYGNQGSEVRELELLRFTGHENISQLFDFDLELKSTDTDLDEDGVINKPCWLEIYYGQGSEPVRVIHGLINEFEDVNYLPDYTLYRAKMVPRIWQLGLFDTNEVYLNETIEQTLTVMLQEAHFVAGQDFRFQLSRNYRTWPFRLQYNETHFDFLQRIIEREGIYYYFEHNNGREVMVFCDNNNQLSAIAQSDQAQTVRFQSNSGINVATGANTVNSIICKRQTLPKIITLRDFNDENPSLDIRGESEINSAGVGAINLYGLNITSPEEGQALAEIHANAFLCRQKSYIGQGDVATMSAGHTFALHNHPKNSFNELEYVIESIEHEGANPNHYVGLNTEDEAPVNYSNSFTALSTAVQFAPKRQTVAPEINGTLNAVVDAEAQSGYAELDPYGRYKIKLPFDSKHRDGGRASHWVRMMQPYGGVGSGMHFPLRAGTRVLLAFIGGDPDRPFISGTINDSGDQQSIVTADNQTSSMIKTASGNKIEIEDKEGSNRIKLQTGDNKTYMHLGAPNHKGDGWVVVTDGMERKFIRGGQNIVVATKSDLVTGGPDLEANDDHGATGPTAAGVSDLDFTVHPQYKFRKRDSNGADRGDFFDASQELDGENLFYRSLGNMYVWEKGNEYGYHSPGDTQFNFGIERVVTVSQLDTALDGNYSRGVSTEVIKNQEFNGTLTTESAETIEDRVNTLDPDGVQIQAHLAGEAAGNAADAQYLQQPHLWLLGRRSALRQDAHDEAHRIYVDENTPPDPPVNLNLVDTFEQKVRDLNGYQSFHPQAHADWKRLNSLSDSQRSDLLDNKSEVTVGRHNTFSYQEGNRFDFGGYWSYNLGNSYTETHGNQESAINRKDPHDLANRRGPHWQHAQGDLVTIVNNKKVQVEKIYSDQYKYISGNVLGIQTGNIEEKIYGAFSEYIIGDHLEDITGNEITKISGDETTTIAGHKKEEVGHQSTVTKGNSIEQYWGTQQSYFMGYKNDMSLGLVTETSVGGRRSTEVAAVMETSLAARSTISAGQVMELTAGVLLEINSATKIDVELSKANTSETDLSTHESRMGLVATKISAEELELTNIGTAICSGALRLFC